MTNPQICRNSRCNLLLDGKDELVERAPTKGSGIHTPIPAMLHALIPTPAPTLSSIDELFEQFMKAYLETQTQPT